MTEKYLTHEEMLEIATQRESENEQTEQSNSETKINRTTQTPNKTNAMIF